MKELFASTDSVIASKARTTLSPSYPEVSGTVEVFIELQKFFKFSITPSS